MTHRTADSTLNNTGRKTIENISSCALRWPPDICGCGGGSLILGQFRRVESKSKTVRVPTENWVFCFQINTRIFLNQFRVRLSSMRLKMKRAGTTSSCHLILYHIAAVVCGRRVKILRRSQKWNGRKNKKDTCHLQYMSFIFFILECIYKSDADVGSQQGDLSDTFPLYL